MSLARAALAFQGRQRRGFVNRRRGCKIATGSISSGPRNCTQAGGLNIVARPKVGPALEPCFQEWVLSMDYPEADFDIDTAHLAVSHKPSGTVFRSMAIPIR